MPVARHDHRQQRPLRDARGVAGDRQACRDVRVHDRGNGSPASRCASLRATRNPPGCVPDARAFAKVRSRDAGKVERPPATGAGAVRRAAPTTRGGGSQAMTDPTMQIGEVADRIGLSLRTIRYYEEVGLITPSARSPGGFRLYTEDDVS